MKRAKQETDRNYKKHPKNKNNQEQLLQLNKNVAVTSLNMKQQFEQEVLANLKRKECQDIQN